MDATIPRQMERSAIAALRVLAAPLTPEVAAQDRPAPVVEFSGGALEFADDAVVTEGFVGGAAQFPSGSYSSSEGAFTAGGGVRALLGNRMMLGAEARVGWELHLRLNVLFGVRLGR